MIDKNAPERAKYLIENNQPDEAFKLINEMLNENPDDTMALFMAAHLFLKAERHGLAKFLYEHLSKTNPEKSQVWNNLGCAYQGLHWYDKGIKAFKKALEIDPNSYAAWESMGLIHLNEGRPEKAIECCKKAIEIKPESQNAWHNYGLSNLLLKNFREGWKGYEWSVGSKVRRDVQYQGESRWDGEKNQTLIVYGEQGLGDEISFASMFPDVIRDSKKVVLECDRRLEGLFKRSFPEADVYGTRWDDEVTWPSKYQLDARQIAGGLGKFYRNELDDFPGTKYLEACPIRKKQWRQTLDDLGDGLKVGIAWTGGRHHTFGQFRSVKLHDMLPILKQDAHFISLQYKDPTEEIENFKNKHGITIHHYPWINSQDYDDTAALVDELDLLITVTTTVVHLGGALGKEVWCLTPKNPIWRYGLYGNNYPWAKSVKLYRQKTSWSKAIRSIADDLEGRIYQSRS